MGGTLASIGTFLGGTAAAASVLDKPKMPDIPNPEPLQDPNKLNEQAKKEMRKRLQARKTKRILTTPLGAAGKAPITKKRLLGE